MIIVKFNKIKYNKLKQKLIYKDWNKQTNRKQKTQEKAWETETHSPQDP